MRNEEDEAEASKSQRASSVPPSSSSSSTKRGQPPHPSETPAKKQSKWSAEEDELIIELRGRGMKWEDISKRLPGRSAISCRLHYQNYLERRSEWDEDRKNKLARLYERQVSAIEPISNQMKYMLRPSCEIDSNRTCGRGSQKKCKCHGVLSKRCIGSWVSKTWHAARAWCHFRCPASPLTRLQEVAEVARQAQGHEGNLPAEWHQLHYPL